MSANAAAPRLPATEAQLSSDEQKGALTLTAPQKAALVIAALGPEAAGPIMEKVGDKHLKAFAEAYARLQDVPRSQLILVAREFVSRIGKSDDTIKGGFEDARALIAKIKGEEDAAKLLEDIDAPDGRSVFNKLDKVDDKAIAEYLESQHPQTVAVILSRMNSDKASSVLSVLKKEVAEDAIMRLSKGVSVRREALRVLEETIDREFLAPARNASKAKKPGLAIGGLMNNLSPDKREAFLKFIEEKTPDIVEDVKSCILTFEDIPARVPPNAIPLVVRQMDADAFLKAMKYGRKNAPESVEFIFKNISQRMKQQYEEQMDALKQVTLADAEAAQALFMSTVRQLVAEGEFQLVKPADPEQEEEVAYI
ncbi:MAG: hypothetical protein GC153_13645 [Alphaproteobacteria bacterium]|nr:hypothetical protein [Alphaproteobacteria bacterium]